MSDENSHPSKDAIPVGYIRFRVSVPDRPDLPEKEILAADEHTAWAKYRMLVAGTLNLPFEPQCERV